MAPPSPVIFAQLRESGWDTEADCMAFNFEAETAQPARSAIEIPVDPGGNALHPVATVVVGCEIGKAAADDDRPSALARFRGHLGEQGQGRAEQEQGNDRPESHTGLLQSCQLRRSNLGREGFHSSGRIPRQNFCHSFRCASRFRYANGPFPLLTIPIRRSRRLFPS